MFYLPIDVLFGISTITENSNSLVTVVCFGVDKFRTILS